MELRLTPRVPLDQAVTLVILGDPETHATAIVRDASGAGLGLVSPIPVASGAALKIEFEDSIFLGEAIYCTVTGAGYAVGVELTQVLSGLAAFARASAKFSEQEDPALAGNH